MTIYIQLLESKIGGTAPMQGQIRQVFSRDDATIFNDGDAKYFVQKAYEAWPNLYWQIERLAPDKYRIMAQLPK